MLNVSPVLCVLFVLFVLCCMPGYMLEIYLNHLEDVFWKLQTQQKYQGKEKCQEQQQQRQQQP